MTNVGFYVVIYLSRYRELRQVHRDIVEPDIGHLVMGGARRRSLL